MAHDEHIAFIQIESDVHLALSFLVFLIVSLPFIFNIKKFLLVHMCVFISYQEIVCFHIAMHNGGRKRMQKHQA